MEVLRTKHRHGITSAKLLIQYYFQTVHFLSYMLFRKKKKLNKPIRDAYFLQHTHSLIRCVANNTNTENILVYFKYLPTRTRRVPSFEEYPNNVLSFKTFVVLSYSEFYFFCFNSLKVIIAIQFSNLIWHDRGGGTAGDQLKLVIWRAGIFDCLHQEKVLSSTLNVSNLIEINSDLCYIYVFLKLLCQSKKLQILFSRV